MFRQDVQVSNGKRYVVIECRFGREWGMVRETMETFSEGEALEIVQYWIKYKRIKPEQIMVIEVPTFASHGESIFNNPIGVPSERLLF